MINIILPTYNEAKNIQVMLTMLSHTLEGMNLKYSIILIDDNSPDGTSKIAKSLGIRNLKVIDRPGKMGLGSAYLEGLKHCSYDHTILLDADLQHDPFSIPIMYKTATSSESLDIVTGTRYSKSGMVCGWPFSRKLTSIGANTLAQYVLGLSSTDLTGSFRCYKTSLLRELIPKITCKSFGFQMEIIARAELMGKRIAEVPIIFYDRVAGESKMSFKEIFNFIKTVAQLYFSI